MLFLATELGRLVKALEYDPLQAVALRKLEHSRFLQVQDFLHHALRRVLNLVFVLLIVILSSARRQGHFREVHWEVLLDQSALNYVLLCLVESATSNWT